MSAETLAGTAMKWRVYVAVAMLLATLAGAAQANSAITGISITEKPDRVVISVQGNCALRMSVLSSPAGKYVGFQFPCRLGMKGRMVGVRGGGIYNVRYGSFRPHPPITRIVVNTARRLDYCTCWSDDKHSVEISVMKSGAKAVSAPKPRSKVKALVQQVGDLSAQVSQPDPEIPEIAAPEVKTATPAQPEATPAAVEPAPEPVKTVEEPAVEPVETVEEPAAEPVKFVAEPAVEPVKFVAEPAVEPVKFVAEPAPEPVETVLEPVILTKEPVILSPSKDASKPTWVARADSGFFSSLVSRNDRKVSVNFLNADINDVLKALAVQSGHNVVASKDVTGNVTVSLNRVSMDEAMDYVAKLSGYTYAKENDTYLVAAKNSIDALAGGASADSAVDVVPVQYTNADDLIALLGSQCPGVKATKATLQGQSGAKPEESTGHVRLILTGSAESIEAGKKLIQQVEDSMMAQADDEVSEVYRVRYVKAGDLAASLTSLLPGISVSPAPTDGFDLSAPQGVDITSSGSNVKQVATSAAAGGTGAAATAASASSANEFSDKKRYSAIVITGQSAVVDKALELAAKLDVRLPQIKIDAKITSITASGEKKLGLTWDWGSLSMQEGSIVKSLTDSVTGKAASFTAGDGKQYRQPFNFGATLEALITNGDGELLASPSLVCLEGKPGVFFVGDEVTYIQRIETTPTGQNITTDTKQVGVQLRVSATTNPDGFITLNLHPEVSVLKLTVQQGVSLPVVSRRFTDHVVRVKSGSTIVIGGLIRNDDVAEMSKVPGLGSIPLFGHLFRHKARTRDHTEVVMFITATVLAD